MDISMTQALLIALITGFAMQVNCWGFIQIVR